MIFPFAIADICSLGLSFLKNELEVIISSCSMKISHRKLNNKFYYTLLITHAFLPADDANNHATYAVGGKCTFYQERPFL
mmetsp:Transcript_17255/g.25337  ORF Transcript_17255/g.25337 Transcript_17255/m.25337 type:complete len:80 (-) Transcript_17255:165-404(-)